MNSIIINYLNKKGYNVSTQYYNSYIAIWEQWWRNELKFHKYHDQSGAERQMYSLGMAKRVCEDWSSILYTERDEIKVNCEDEKQTQLNQEFLSDKLKELKIYNDLPAVLEKGMAMGTAGAVIRIKHAGIDDNNNLIVNNRTKLDIIYLDASQIVPLKVEHGNIVDVAFCSESNIGDKRMYYIETHILQYDEKLQKDVYHITNTYLNEEGREIERDGVIKEYTIESNTPLFAIFTPAIANPVNSDYVTINGLGYSVFGNAIDELKGCDIAFNNFVMDFYLGGKKVFYNKKIVKEKTRTYKRSDGTYTEQTFPVYPDDITRQQWATYGDEMSNLKDNPAITEYNPDLRINDNKEGIQQMLDLLSFKCGLGTKYYQFNNTGSSNITATQYVGERQDLVDNANKHRKKVDDFIGSICKSILLLGRILLGENVTEECEINVVDKDGFMVDTETAKQEFRQDIAQGIRQAWEYRVKFLGEDEETAKKMTGEIKINEINIEEETE